MTNLRLRVLPQIPPINGKEIELGVSATHIQWRYVNPPFPAEEWVDLIALSDIEGPVGPSIDLRVEGAYVQYAPEGSGDWENLIPLADLKGDKGDKGWAQNIVMVSDGARRVQQLIGYVGGEGVAPTDNVGLYLKGDGTWTANIAQAADIRGPGGTGTVVEVVAGEGIEVDSTDPASPVVSVSIQPSLPPGYIYNLTISNNVADATNDLDIAAGFCRSVDNAGDIRLVAAITKRLDANWAAGTGNGMLDAGSKANSTWYHIFAIGRTDGSANDVLASTSATNPTMPSGYTLKRRIGSVRVESSGVIRQFLQIGGEFFWHRPVIDANDIAVSAEVSFIQAITTPIGIKTKAILAPFPRLTANYFAIRDPDMAGAIDTYWSVIFSPNSSTGTKTAGAIVEVWTNNISQVQCFAGDIGTFLLFTRGWYDPRDTYL